MIDLILTKKDSLIGNGKVKGNLSCSDHKMVELRILRAERRVKSNITTGWTSGVQTLISSEICMEEYYGIRPWRGEGPKKTG